MARIVDGLTYLFPNGKEYVGYNLSDERGALFAYFEVSGDRVSEDAEYCQHWVSEFYPPELDDEGNQMDREPVEIVTWEGEDTELTTQDILEVESEEPA